jgi:hypothetical protein
MWSFPSCCPDFLSEEMHVEGLTLIFRSESCVSLWRV